MLTQVIFALTRTLGVRFDFFIGKNDIFRRSLGIEHHFLTQKIIFAAARVNFFFVTRCAGNKPIISFGLSTYGQVTIYDRVGGLLRRERENSPLPGLASP